MKRIHISLFKNVWDKNPTIINLYEYLTKHIGTNLNGAQQQRYRQLLDEGRKEEAQEVKKSQECAVFGGVCAGGRGEKCLTSISGAAGFDLDHVGGRLAEIKGMLQLPFVYAVYTTFSGEGLRVVVNMGTDKAEEMRSRYLLVARFLSRLCNHPCDMQCKDIARASFTSFDPDIWINPDNVEPFPLPAGYGQDAPQETAAPAKEQPGEQAGEGMPDGTEGHGTPAGEEPGMIEGVLQDFARKNYGGEGHRNRFFLGLGSYAYYRHLSPSELDELIRITASRMQDDEYRFKEISSRIRWGYEHPGTSSGKDKKCQSVKSVTIPFSDTDVSDEEADTEEDADKFSPENLPFLDDTVFEGLPEVLEKGIAAARTKAERDMLALSMLANLSGCMPNVQINYADRLYTPHLYFFAIAKAGSGKGVMSLAGMMPKLIQEDFDKEYRQQLAKFKTEHSQWEMRMKNWKNGDEDDPEPEEPIQKYILQPAATSHSRLVRNLANNPHGIILNCTELDMITNSLNQDCGHFDDILRAAFHHEEVAIDYKVDKHKIVAYETRVAGSMAGTHGQFVRFCGSGENGMFSRGMYYTVPRNASWISAQPHKHKPDNHSLFRELAAETRDIYHFLHDSPTMVHLTDEQWTKHDEAFSRMLNEVRFEEGSDMESVVFRLGLIAGRLATVFTAMRKYEGRWNMKDIYCTDEDFDRTMSIIKVLLEHGMTLSTIFPEAKVTPRKMNYFFRYRTLLEKLPHEFTRRDFLKLFVSNGVSVSTCNRLLKLAKEKGYIKKMGNVYIKVGYAWYKRGTL